MTDSVLLSLENSPVAQTLIDQSDVSDWIYSVKTSMAPVSKNRYIVDSSESNALTALSSKKSNIKFELQRYGVVLGMVLHHKIKITNAEAATNDYKVQHGGGFNLQSEVRLQSRNRTIQTLTPLYQQSKLNELPEAKRDVIKALSYYSGGVVTMANSSNETIEMYVPLFFSCCWDLKNSVDTQFAETLQVSCDFVASAFNSTTSTDSMIDFMSLDNTELSAQRSTELIVYYANFPTDIYRSIQDKNYNIQPGNKSLNYVWEDVYVESITALATTNADGAEQTTNVSLNCRNLAKRILVRVRENAGNQGGLDGNIIERIDLKGNGKVIRSYNGVEMMVENALLSGLAGAFQRLGGRGGTAISGAETLDGDEQTYVIDLGFSHDQDHYSGALSLKGVSNASLDIITQTSEAGATASNSKLTKNIAYEIFVEVEYYNIVSLNPMDGKFSVSSNL